MLCVYGTHLTRVFHARFLLLSRASRAKEYEMVGCCCCPVSKSREMVGSAFLLLLFLPSLRVTEMLDYQTKPLYRPAQVGLDAA